MDIYMIAQFRMQCLEMASRSPLAVDDPIKLAKEMFAFVTDGIDLTAPIPPSGSGSQGSAAAIRQ